MNYRKKRTHILFDENETVCGLLLSKFHYLIIVEDDATCCNCYRKRSFFSDNYYRIDNRKKIDITKLKGEK